VPGTHLPLKPKAKGKGGTAKPKKPVSVKVPGYLSYGTARVELAAGGDNEIGVNTPNCPWVDVETSLTGDPIFYVTTQNSKADGSAYVTRENKVKGRIVVAGAELKTAPLPLADGETIRVYDDSEETQGYYELTFEQK
jgi:hypothetical protein